MKICDLNPQKTRWKWKRDMNLSKKDYIAVNNPRKTALSYADYNNTTLLNQVLGISMATGREWPW